MDIHRRSHNMPTHVQRAESAICARIWQKFEKNMAKQKKRDWSKVRQAFKDALPESAEFNRVDCLNLLMFLAHNPNEGLLIQDLEVRLPDLGPKVESIVSKLIALGLVKNSRQHGTQLSSKAIELMSAPRKDDVEDAE